MISAGKCSLIMRGYELNFDEIGYNIKINPSRIIKKGEVVSKVIGESECDIWIYEIKLDEGKSPNKTLGDILYIFNPYKDYIQELARHVDVSIKCYVQSDYAQIYFDISPNVIMDLANIGIKLEISILSWGGAT